MNETIHDIYITGLRNAHAMEIQARELMERQSERLDDYPDVKAAITSIWRRRRSRFRVSNVCWRIWARTIRL